MLYSCLTVVGDQLKNTMQQQIQCSPLKDNLYRCAGQLPSYFCDVKVEANVFQCRHLCGSTLQSVEAQNTSATVL